MSYCDLGAIYTCPTRNAHRLCRTGDICLPITSHLVYKSHGRRRPREDCVECHLPEGERKLDLCTRTILTASAANEVPEKLWCITGFIMPMRN